MAFYHQWSQLVLIASSGILMGCSSSEEKKLNEDVHYVEETSGKETYEVRCVACHGGKGDLGIAGAADLTVSEMSLNEKIYIITNGSENGGMTPFNGLLSEKEIDAVAAYTETLKK